MDQSECRILELDWHWRGVGVDGAFGDQQQQGLAAADNVSAWCDPPALLLGPTTPPPPAPPAADRRRTVKAQ